MARSGKQQAALRVSADRLASVVSGASYTSAAAAADAAAAAPKQRLTHEPDLSRMRPRGIEETPDQRKRRLAAKTVNFTATILARLLIIAALGLYAYDIHESSGAIHRGAAAGIVAMLLDFGRVLMKAMQPGTK